MGMYKIGNYAMPTTAAVVKVTTGTAVKTMLQVKSATLAMRIIEWGISFDGSAAATPINCELMTSGAIAATVTAHSETGVVKLGPNVSDQLAAATVFSLGTSTTGFTATVEGSITAVKMFDNQLIAPTNQYVKQFPLGREPVALAADYLRIRVTAGAAVNALCYVIVEPF